MTATLVNVPSTASRATAPAPGRAAPAGAKRRAPELRVVDQPQRRRPVGLVVAAAVIVLFGALFLNAIFHSVLVSGQARLDGLDQQVSQAQTENQQRHLRVAQLESPDRIVRAATAAGMRVPDRTHWLLPQRDGGAISSTSDRATPSDTTPTSSSTGAAELAAGPDATVPADR